jgi:hypothetical protein
MFRGLLIACLSLLLTRSPALALQPPTAPPDGFVPIDTLPPGEEMPAAPLLIAAYVFFLLLMMFYLWTIWRRLGAVEREMHDLERRGAGGHVR